MARSPDIVDHDSALAYLFGRIDYERADRFPYLSRGLNLDRMRELASRLGDPQQRFPVVHVAGTKGKGSTSGMIAAVLTASGYRTGLYTSPHVDCVEERTADRRATLRGRRIRRLDPPDSPRGGRAGPRV